MPLTAIEAGGLTAASEAVTLAAVQSDDLARTVYGVFGIPIDLVDMSAIVHRIEMAAVSRVPLLISTANLNFLVSSRNDAKFRESLLLSDLCTADGMPIVWITRLLGLPIKERIAGSDIFDTLKFRKNSSRQLKIFLFGGADGVAVAAKQKINAEATTITCVGSLYPGFGTVDEISADPIIRAINSHEADFLIVALGAKKGQSWLRRNHDRLQVPVRAHLGAALNFQAGTVKRAPLFMRRCGLEWLWRIWEEPQLWLRYSYDGLILMRLLATRAVPLLIVMRWDLLRLGRKTQNLLVTRGENYKSVILTLKGAAIARQVSVAIPHFREALAAGKPVVINFSQTCLIDARFIGLLLMLDKELKKKRLPLTFAELPTRLANRFRLNGFGFLLGPRLESVS